MLINWRRFRLFIKGAEKKSFCLRQLISFYKRLIRTVYISPKYKKNCPRNNSLLCSLREMSFRSVIVMDSRKMPSYAAPICSSLQCMKMFRRPMISEKEFFTAFMIIFSPFKLIDFAQNVTLAAVSLQDESPSTTKLRTRGKYLQDQEL